jgi:hypothetical protein
MPYHIFKTILNVSQSSEEENNFLIEIDSQVTFVRNWRKICKVEAAGDIAIVNYLCIYINDDLWPSRDTIECSFVHCHI